MAVHNRVHESYCAWEDRRYRPGDVAIGGEFFFLPLICIKRKYQLLCPVLPFYRKSIYHCIRGYFDIINPDIYGLVINVSHYQGPYCRHLIRQFSYILSYSVE